MIGINKIPFIGYPCDLNVAPSVTKKDSHPLFLRDDASRPDFNSLFDDKIERSMLRSAIFFFPRRSKDKVDDDDGPVFLFCLCLCLSHSLFLSFSPSNSIDVFFTTCPRVARIVHFIVAFFHSFARR